MQGLVHKLHFRTKPKQKIHLPVASQSLNRSILRSLCGEMQWWVVSF